MHKFTSLSGKQLWYDVRSNRIGIWTPDKNENACPRVNFKAPSKIETKITLFTIEMTQQCNLRCSYCCYSGNYRDRRAHNEKEISYEILQQVVGYVKNYAKKESEITVCFYGGEALLAKRKIEWVINKLHSIFNGRIRYSLSTNGLALNGDIVDWICSIRNFFVYVTIDGDKFMHDIHRKTISGNGSYDIIIRNLKLFKNKYPEIYRNRVRFLSTVYSWDDVLYLAEVWDKEPVLRGQYPIHISHIIPNFNDKNRVYDTWKIKDNFYKKSFEVYKRGEKGILYGCFQKLIDIIDNRNYLRLPEELEIRTCFQGLYSCFINVDGDLYACEKFCGELKVGNVKQGIIEDLIFPLLNIFTDRKNRLCSSCWAQRFCRTCMTSLNFTDDELLHMCKMERETIDLALKYYCAYKDWVQLSNRN